MRKLLLMCMIAVPLAAVAEQVRLNKEVVCDDASNILPQLIQLGEQPIFAGTLTESSVVFMVNPDTQSWTVVQTDGNVACVIDVGEGFKFQLPKSNPIKN
jgi:hypothetical protein